MKAALSTRERALTLFEVLLVVAILAVLAALVLHAPQRRQARSSRINCVNNLKQTSLAFRIWATDQNDFYPMSVSTNSGGAMEWAEGADLFRVFLVMSNELSTPKVLICPEDVERHGSQATIFETVASLSVPHVSFTSNSNLSYFLGVDAQDVYPSRFLTGDRNITNGTPLRNGVLVLLTNRPGAWTANIHVNQGNVALADGSVQAFTTDDLQKALLQTGLETNRLAMPY